MENLAGQDTSQQQRFNIGSQLRECSLSTLGAVVTVLERIAAMTDSTVDSTVEGNDDVIENDPCTWPSFTCIIGRASSLLLDGVDRLKLEEQSHAMRLLSVSQHVLLASLKRESRN